MLAIKLLAVVLIRVTCIIILVEWHAPLHTSYIERGGGLVFADHPDALTKLTIAIDTQLWKLQLA